MAFRPLFRTIGRSIAATMCAIPYSKVKCLEDKQEDNKFQLSELTTEKLSFEYMIKQSALDAANNVSKMLTVTYTALEVTSQEYRDLLLKLINLTRETFMFEVQDDHWDQILNTRLKLQNKKRIVMELTQYMEYVHKMATATTEICYSAGMENLSHTLNDRIDDALNKIKNQLDMNMQLETEYIDIQEQSIEKTKKHPDTISKVDDAK